VLKHIPELLTPELLKVMMEMGHGEELLLCDANYPAKSSAGERIYVTGCSITELLTYVLHYFPGVVISF
jgi:L-fucose mutarotase